MKNYGGYGHGDTYTRLRAKIRATPPKYATRTATSPRDGKNMKNYVENPLRGALQLPNRDFSGVFSLFGPYRPKTRGKSKEISDLNNRLLGTAHNLPRPRLYATMAAVALATVGDVRRSPEP